MTQANGLVLTMPIREQRRRWQREGDVLVAAQLDTREPITAFSTTGEARILDSQRAPTEWTIAIVPSELDALLVAADSKRLDALASSELAKLLPSSITDDCENAFIECIPDGQGASGGSGTPSYPTGVYMTQMRIWDKAEPWIRGDPEIELVILGNVTGKYSAAVWPGPAAPDLRYTAGEFLTPIACSGRLAPTVHGGVKNFDFNSEGGTTYDQTVLLEEQAEFKVREEVEGAYGTILFSRDVSPHPPFMIQAWERDDGGECPKLADPWFPPFLFAYRLSPTPGLRFTPLPGSGDRADWRAQLGITNENDLLGSWSFGNWDDFEAMSASVLLIGAKVDVRLKNTGVTRYTMPIP